MKKINILLSIFVFALFCGGCENKDEYPGFAETQLIVKSADVAFSAAAGSGTIIVSETDAVSATSDRAWCKTSVSGNTVAVNVDANNSISGRTALISLRAGDRVNYVPVTQKGAVLTLSATSVDAGGKGGEARIAFEADITVSSISSPDEWITGSVEGQELVLQFSANPSYAAIRTGKVSLTLAGGAVYDRIITVTQAKNYLTYEELDYEHFLGEYTMSYSTTYSSTTPTRSATVSLVQAVEGETYYLKGLLSAADDELGNITVQFVNNDDGKGIVILGQIMFQRANGDDFWLLSLSVDNYSSRSTTYGLRGYTGRDGQIKIVMEDNGVWTRGTAGFMLRNYTGSTSAGSVNGKDGQPYYCYLVFEKQ